MIRNYMACSIQNYGSDALRFTLRRSVIHSHCTPRPSRKKKITTYSSSRSGAALRVKTYHFTRPSPCANKSLLTSSDYTVFKKNQYRQSFVGYLFTDERL